MRPCDGCTACCYVLGIEELKKPPNALCPNMQAAGCGIYETRPASCSGFNCLWRLKQMSEKDRPDVLGVVFSPTKGPTEFTGEVEVQAFEVEPDALSRPEVVAAAKKFVDRGRLVIGHTAEGLRFFGPATKVARARAWALRNS